VGDVDCKGPLQALTQYGFFDLPLEARTLVLAKVGQIFLAASFASIRDTMRNAGEKPIGVEDLAAIAEKGTV
jgi:hypothetical protein